MEKEGEMKRKEEENGGNALVRMEERREGEIKGWRVVEGGISSASCALSRLVGQT